MRSVLAVSLFLGSAAAFTACSSPTSTGGAKSRDLGGFVVQGESDLSTGAVADMAKNDLSSSSSVDLAQKNDLSSSGGSGCGSVTYAGFCTGSVVTWCEFGDLQELDCADDFLDCTVVMGDADCR